MVLPTSDEGLSTAQAAQRLQQDGLNELPGEQRRGLRAIARELSLIHISEPTRPY